MPPPKKAAKKIAAKHSPNEDASRDLRRAYEHLGRVEILHRTLEKNAAKSVEALSEVAQRELAAGHMQDAADLLRAAEHLSFGTLHSGKAEKEVSPKLVAAITKEFRHKLEKAEEHWSDETVHDKGVEEIYSRTTARAQEAFDEGAYRQALELARAVEALAHVKVHGSKQLGSGVEQPKLHA